jgi:uncharacterized protein (DUF58 family)
VRAAERHAFFTPEFLAQLERLTLASRRVFRGRVKGERKSPRRGHSVEFCDYRAYGVGDDLRYVDWNAYARLDRLHVKLFVDEEDLCLHLLVDASASMDFGSPTKLDYAVRLAAALGFVGLVGLERVGVGILRERVAEGWAPTRGRNQFPALLDFLTRVKPAGPTRLNDAMAAYALRARESGLAVIISDLLDPVGFEAGLRALMERRFDIHLIHLLDPEEMAPELAGDFRLTDAETGEVQEISVDREAIRAYREKLHAFLERAENFCRAHEIGYHRVITDTPVEAFVLAQLKGLVLA